MHTSPLPKSEHEVLHHYRKVLYIFHIDESGGICTSGLYIEIGFSSHQKFGLDFTHFTRAIV